MAERILAIFHTCPVPEIARLGRTLRRWKDAFLAYFTTERSNNGGTEAINGIIELHRRLARGYRNRRQLPTPHAPRRRRTQDLIPTGSPKSPYEASAPLMILGPKCRHTLSGDVSHRRRAREE